MKNLVISITSITPPAATPILFINASTISSMFSPAPVMNRILRTNVGTSTIVTAFLCSMSNLSWKPETTACRIDTIDVIPAVSSAPKKQIPNNALSAGSVLIAVGNVMNASPIPEPAMSATSTPCCIAMKPMILNTPIPAKISNP